MDINKYKESIQIAEEISKEICTGKDSTSRLVKKWKKNSAGLHKELQQQQKLAEEIKFRDSIELEGPLRNIHQRISPSRKLFIRTSGIAASLILAVALTSLWLWQKEEREAVRWASTVPGKEPSSIITCDNRAVTLKENRCLWSTISLSAAQATARKILRSPWNKTCNSTGSSYRQEPNRY